MSRGNERNLIHKYTQTRCQDHEEYSVTLTVHMKKSSSLPMKVGFCHAFDKRSVDICCIFNQTIVLCLRCRGGEVRERTSLRFVQNSLFGIWYEG